MFSSCIARLPSAQKQALCVFLPNTYWGSVGNKRICYVEIMWGLYSPIPYLPPGRVTMSDFTLTSHHLQLRPLNPKTQAVHVYMYPNRSLNIQIHPCISRDISVDSAPPTPSHNWRAAVEELGYEVDGLGFRLWGSDFRV